MFYLKYRPQKISELDNKKIRESLGQALLENKWVHAYLLVGPKGTGKTTTARLIAKIVNCPNRKKGEEPCNKCGSCKSITTGSSLDVIEIDGASNTGVDDVRDLREKAKLSPSSSKYKVYIIDEVHMLSTSAFNALLKILEEPPEHVIFVLATTEAQKLPATVVSRCLVYNFGETTKEDVVRKLRQISTEEKVKMREEVLVKIVETTGTSHRDAQKLLEQMTMGKAPDFEALVTQLPIDYADKILSAVAERNSQRALEQVAKFVEADGKIKDLISALVSRLRDKLLFEDGDRSDVVELLNMLIEANALLRDSPIPQLPLEMVIVEFCRSAKSENSDSSENPKKSDESEFQKPESSESSGFSESWPKAMEELKKYNHSLVAFLRASRPVELTKEFLTLEVFYKFHKERLEEKKNREVLEKVVSDIMGQDLKVKFVLAEKR